MSPSFKSHASARTSEDAELTSFWNSLRHISPQDSILRFPVKNPLLPSHMKGIYIRKAYEDLFTIICNNRNSKDLRTPHRGMAITGTPGIGKSIFLIYVLWRVANMDSTKTVVLRQESDEGYDYIFRNDGCWRTNDPYDNGRDLLKDSDSWYLADSLESQPGTSRATTVAVMYPYKYQFNAFLKFSHVAELHYLPVWSLEELKKAAPLHKRSLKEVGERHGLIGGIPFYVLASNYSIEISSMRQLAI